MSKKTNKNNKILFCQVFDFIMEHFSIKAKPLCDCSNGAFSETSISSWKTRNPPGSEEVFGYLLTVVKDYLTNKHASDMFDRGDYIKKVSGEIAHYCKLPDFLVSPNSYSIIELVGRTLEFSYLNQKMLPCDTHAEITNESEPLVEHHSSAKTEAVVFDFDGTLTTTKVRTTWESIWTLLGYTVQDCVDLHIKFSNNEISHKEWCFLTEEKFKARKLHKSQLAPLIESTKLITGIEEVLQELDKRGIQVYIVSGSIKYIILKSLGALAQYVSGGIDANVFDFDEEGYLSQIIGTAYDFEGKAARITKIAQDLSISPNQILFVGNSLNDEWAHSSGARTLAINPKNTNMFNKNIWDDCIVQCDSLVQILKYI